MVGLSLNAVLCEVMDFYCLNLYWNNCDAWVGLSCNVSERGHLN